MTISASAGAYPHRHMEDHLRRQLHPDCLSREEVNRYPLKDVSGTITFTADGKINYSTNTQMFCNRNGYVWEQSGDSLVICYRENGVTYPINSVIRFIADDTIKIEHAPGCGRMGLGVWYEVQMAK